MAAKKERIAEQDIVRRNELGQNVVIVPKGQPIPEGFDYAAVRGLSAEVQQKLARVNPQTVGQAQRIPGMTPAAISLLLVHLARGGRNRVA